MITKTQYIGAAVLLATSLTSMAPHAAANWMHTVDDPIGDNPFPVSDSCINSFAYAAANSGGTSCWGTGLGYDDTPFCSVRAQTNATDQQTDRWTYTPGDGDEPLGWANIEVCSEVNGLVSLRSANTAAAALGYALGESNLCQTRAIARLTDSAGATSGNTLGELTLGGDGFGLKIPITTGSGGPPLRDHDEGMCSGTRCTNEVCLYRKCRASVSFYADEALHVAVCEGDMDGEVTYSLNTEKFCSK